MVSSPLALSPVLPSELIAYILNRQAYPITLIICQPRAAFLNSLQSIPQHMPQEPPPPPPGSGLSDPLSDHVSEPSERHALLIPTLHQVATSRYITLMFMPSLSHLRAYLAVFPSKNGEPPPKQRFQKPGKHMPLLMVYGMVAMHRDTSEWSAQGLGHSLAGLVEAGWRSGRKIVVLEERRMDHDLGDLHGDELLEEEREKKKQEVLKVWEERVPMLNGSVRRAGLESEDGGWSGRTIEVGRILGRWFTFEEGDWDKSA